MNILIVCEKADGSDGWSRYAQTLHAGLCAKGHTVTICSTKNGLPSPLYMLTRPYLIPVVAHYIRKMIKAHQPDVIHITVEPYALATCWIPRNIRRKLVLTIHGNYGIRPLRWWMSRQCMKHALGHIMNIITVSHFTKERVTEELFHNGWEFLAMHFRQRATVIHNGILLPPYEKNSKTSTHCHHLLHVGGIKSMKGILETLDACYAYRQQYDTDFLLTIVGTVCENNPYTQKVFSRIIQLDLGKHIIFAGRVSDEQLYALYRKSDVFIMPSLTLPDTFEGFGLVYLEANAHGTPCIGPKESGASEAISEGLSGYHVDPKNPEEIAERLHWILDEKRINPLGCRKWAEEHTIDYTINAILRVYTNSN